MSLRECLMFTALSGIFVFSATKSYYGIQHENAQTKLRNEIHFLENENNRLRGSAV